MESIPVAEGTALRPKPAKRMAAFGEYLFDEIAGLKANVQARGVEVIDLSVGDPDGAAPPEAVAELQRQAEQTANHRYPSYKGLPEFRTAVARWYFDTFGVNLQPNDEVLSLIGSKGGVTHMPLTLVNPGDYVLLPDPAYAAYPAGVQLAEGRIYSMPLLERNGYLPDLEAVPSEIARAAKLMILNYPNNPTTACATEAFFADVVDFARQHGIFIAHDAPYNLMAFEGQRKLSFLETPGAKDVGIEFHSFSKLFNMTGWRVAFCAGNPELVSLLGTLKSNLDMGIFLPIQYAAIKALDSARPFIENLCGVYQRRRDVLVEGLRQLGWRLQAPRATFYVWAPVPDGTDSWSFTCRLLEQTGVLVTPGVGFGPCGEGYIRVALTVSEERLGQVIARLREVGFTYS